MTDLLAPADRLRHAGLRVTEPRIAVLTALEEHPHASAERVQAALAESRSRLSIQSVHNVLRDLTRHAVLRRIEPSNSPALYEARVGDNHHHLVCRSCDTVTDVPCVLGEAPCLDPADTAGYDVDEAEIVFWGICPGCRARDIRPSAT